MQLDRPLDRLDGFASGWSTLSALLDEALALPTAAHAGWLESLGGERAAHREGLRALLGRHTKVAFDDFLGSLPSLDLPHDAQPADDLVPGGRIGAYRLVRELGRGGMGTVWLAERVDGPAGFPSCSALPHEPGEKGGVSPCAARRCSPVGRPGGLAQRQVALKLPRNARGGDFAERLARERRILATLDHPHIARLDDAGPGPDMPDERPFLALEFVDGDPIDTHCATLALPLRARLALLLQVMAAVSHAHSRSVVHLDLKPDNILVGADGRVKLLDFGIAAMVDAKPVRPSTPVDIAVRALTLDFASPEQIRGEAPAATSDVYSLGILAFELLVGARPYHLAPGSTADLEEAIATVPRRRASQAATVPAVREALRGDLDAVLEKAMKKVSTERYQSVDAFARDIERWLAGKPVRARAAVRRGPAATPARRLRFGRPTGSAGQAKWSAPLNASLRSPIEGGKNTSAPVLSAGGGAADRHVHRRGPDGQRVPWRAGRRRPTALSLRTR